MYACICRGLADADVRRAGRAGALSPEALVVVLGLDDSGCCGRCVDEIERFVELAHEGADLPHQFGGSDRVSAPAAPAHIAAFVGA